MTKHFTSSVGLIALAIGGVAGGADAPSTGADCAANFKMEGNFLAGKKYSTWTEYAAVSKADLFSRVVTNVAKDGWTINSSDKETGIISASSTVSYGKGSVAPLTIVIEPSGNGSKATATFHVGGGQTAKEATVRDKICSYIG